MSEILSLIESLDAQRDAIHRTFDRDGINLRRRWNSPQWNEKVAEFVNVWADVETGRRPMWYLREVMTTSDFPYLFGDVLDRRLLAAYKRYPAEWRKYIKTATVPDFRAVKRFAMNTGSKKLDEVLEKGEYTPIENDETKYEYSVSKFGNQKDYSWESIINDDLGALKRAPEELAVLAANTEYWFATNLFASAAAWASAFGTAAYTGTAQLSVSALRAGITTMLARTDPGGAPIYCKPVWLVVPPQLEFEARTILESVQLDWEGPTVSGTAGAGYTYGTKNVIAGMLKLVVNPWLPIVDTSHGTTAWYLFADYNNVQALEVGFLRGHETPEVRMKSPDSVLLGGGPVSPMEGSFLDDDVAYRVRHIIGGVRMDWRGVYASDGSTAQPAVNA